MLRRLFGISTFLVGFAGVSGFLRFHSCTTKHSTILNAAGKGFGSPGKNPKKSSPKKTYAKEAVAPIKDLIDIEGAMNEFFRSNEAWHPLFRSIVGSSNAPAMTFIKDVDTSAFEFSENSSPWKRLDGIPSKDQDREVLADFLDKMQTSLVDIPVDEFSKDDEHDLHFIEEGRRMLVCSRFHVIQGVEKGSIAGYESLFKVCWNEVMHLRNEDDIDTGSLILVPDLDIDDLRRFTDMNLQRPLQWLGIDGKFEVASMERGSPAIRLIHRLSDIPTDVGTPPPQD